MKYHFTSTFRDYFSFSTVMTYDKLNIDTEFDKKLPYN